MEQPKEKERKRFRHTRWNKRFLAMVFILASSTLSGCLKDDNQVYQVAAVRALNAVPGSESLDVFLGNNKLNFDNMAIEDESFAYTDTIPYKNAWPNKRIVSVVDPDDYPDAKPLIQDTVTFVPGKFYSLFVAGYEELVVLHTADDLTQPSGGMAKVRFIHLSPDAPALDFELQSSEEESFTVEDKAYMECSNFQELKCDGPYTVSFVDHRTGGELHSFEFMPDSGMIYTIWVKGLIDHAADTSLGFGHGVLVH